LNGSRLGKAETLKAETAAGEIITLEKECTCITHNDPHWIYMDRLDRERNRKVLEAGTFLALMRMAIEETTRLAEKRHHFERLGIVRVIAEPCDALTDAQKAELARRGAQYAKEAAAKLEAMKPPPPPEDARALAKRRVAVEKKAEALQIGLDTL